MKKIIVFFILVLAGSAGAQDSIEAKMPIDQWMKMKSGDLMTTRIEFPPIHFMKGDSVILTPIQQWRFDSMMLTQDLSIEKKRLDGWVALSRDSPSAQIISGKQGRMQTPAEWIDDTLLRIYTIEKGLEFGRLKYEESLKEPIPIRSIDLEEIEENESLSR